MQQKFASDARNWFIMRIEWRQNYEHKKVAAATKAWHNFSLENILQLSPQ